MGCGKGRRAGRRSLVAMGLLKAASAWAEDPLTRLEPARPEVPRPEVPAQQPVSEGCDGLRKDDGQGFQVRPFGRVFARMKAGGRADLASTSIIKDAFVGGVNLLYSRHFEAQFQAEHALRPGDEFAGIEYSVQLATRF